MPSNSHLIFEYPAALWLGGCLAVALLVLFGMVHRRCGTPRWQRLTLLALRAAALGLVVFLLARPIRLTRDESLFAHRTVAVLVDASESMSVTDTNQTRYQQALQFLVGKLLPAMKEAGLSAQPMLFAEHAQPLAWGKLSAAAPKGRRTNLGGAVAQALEGSAAPLAIISLTDGRANETADNARALTGLLENRVPFIGVGFGSDEPHSTLTLRRMDAPAQVAPKAAFKLSVQMEHTCKEELPACELLLLRDGQILQTKNIPAGKGARQWVEEFQHAEETPGIYQYEVRLMPPQLPQLRCPVLSQKTMVNVTGEKEVRVLFLQGALTWDYKFIGLALQHDPAFRLTGLTRTARQSFFRQNVENPNEMTNGFPTSLEELAPFRIIVISNLRPSDLTRAQQELLVKYCSEHGGGLLMIGGSSTFDATWEGSTLEKMLPVTFDLGGPMAGAEQPFRLALTDEAMAHPVFQIAESDRVRQAWSQLPPFTRYGRVESAKPGAQIWAVHATGNGPRGPRPLIAIQRYGAGLSAAVCLQNFWRWRLARDSEPAHFDRFWRQLLRYMADTTRIEASMNLPAQELRPNQPVRLAIEKQPSPGAPRESGSRFELRVENEDKKLLQHQVLTLETSRPVEVTFPGGPAGLYTFSLLNEQKNLVASRPVEIREFQVEYLDTSRSMETLRQWAAVSGGLACKAEDCASPNELVRHFREKAADLRRNAELQQPVGMNAWVLAVLLSVLAADWIMRKKWGLA